MYVCLHPKTVSPKYRVYRSKLELSTSPHLLHLEMYFWSHLKEDMHKILPIAHDGLHENHTSGGQRSQNGLLRRSTFFPQIWVKTANIFCTDPSVGRVGVCNSLELAQVRVSTPAIGRF